MKVLKKIYFWYILWKLDWPFKLVSSGQFGISKFWKSYMPLPDPIKVKGTPLVSKSTFIYNLSQPFAPWPILSQDYIKLFKKVIKFYNNPFLYPKGLYRP